MIVHAVQLAGIGMIALAVGSLAIPVLLGWKAELTQLRPLTRQIFWTYAGYIASAHLLFGVGATFGGRHLVAGGPLPAAVCAFIALWWSARVILQFLAFDRTEAARVPHGRLLESLLVTAFLYFAAVFIIATVANLT